MRIAFLCTAHTGNAWTADTAKAGIGGSEEATIHLAELLGRRGHQVSVNMPGAQGLTVGAVRYDDYHALRGEDVDVAVMWRFPELAAFGVDWGFPADFTFRARRSYLWLHDTMPADRVLPHAHRYQKVILLSNAHRSLYPQLSDNRILLSSNGIDLDQFEGHDEGARDPHLMVYGSDYERGLATLLSRWPAIKNAVPQARLNVFYGWQTLEAIFPERAAELHREIDPLLAQPGVTHLGKIGHQDVAAQYSRAGVWAYPCRYFEVSCISAMKAQAGGAVPVIISAGALNDVVRFGFRTRRGYEDTRPDDEADLEREWLDGLIGMLKSPDEQDRIRREMIPASRARFAWSTVADQWEREFAAPLPGPASGPSATRRPGLCLNMIVRNEAHIIGHTLDSVARFISSWVIVDTGSDDGTQDVIRDQMARLGIPGELHERPWRDFSHNRNEALALARGRGDYILTMDADDLIVGTPDFTRLDAAVYYLRIRNDDDIYWFPHLFRDDVTVSYEGVVHEDVLWDSGRYDALNLAGDYHIESRRLGARNQDPQKYARDRDLLLAAVERNPEDGRSVFYLARSYFDLARTGGQIEDFAQARKWYARRAAMGGSEQEVFYSLYELAESMAQLGAPWPDVHDAYVRAWDFRPARAEPLYAIARRYREQQRYRIGYEYAKLAAAIPFPDPLTDFFFVRSDIYNWRAIDEQAVCASWIDKPAEAFTLWRGLLARATLPAEDRLRIAANRDLCAPPMIEQAGSYPEAVVQSLVASSGSAEVVVSLVAGPELAAAEQTLNSFLNCCTDVSQAGRFLVIDAGLHPRDRAVLQERYGFLEFSHPGPAPGPGAGLAQIRAQLDGLLWLHLGEGWRFFAPENLITRLIEVLRAEPPVFQVGINVTDATGLTGECAPEQIVRRAPGAGRYVLTDTPASGPAMFDTARLRRAGDLRVGDTDPLAELGRRATAAGLRTASLDEVLCVKAG
jgi:glycosyltransferase involved in cell wall biosynthesis